MQIFETNVNESFALYHEVWFCKFFKFGVQGKHIMFVIILHIHHKSVISHDSLYTFVSQSIHVPCDLNSFMNKHLKFQIQNHFDTPNWQIQDSMWLKGISCVLEDIVRVFLSCFIAWWCDCHILVVYPWRIEVVVAYSDYAISSFLPFLVCDWVLRWIISFARICWMEALYGENASWWMEIRSERKDL